MGVLERWLERADVAATERSVHEARSCWAHLAAIVLLDMVGTWLILLAPVPVKIAVDSVLGSSPLPRPMQALLPARFQAPVPLLWVVATMLVAIVFLMQLQTLVVVQLRTRTAERITRRFRIAMFAHVQALPMTALHRLGTADLIYRLQWDALAVQWIVVGHLVPYVSSTISFAFMLVVVARIDLHLAVATVAVMPLMVLLSKRHRRRMPPLYEALKMHESRAFGVFERALPFIRLVKAYGEAPNETARFAELSSVTVASRLRSTAAENRFGLVVNTLPAMATGAVLFIGFSHIRAGALTVGELLIVIAYLAGIFAPLNSVVHLFANMQEQITGARRCFAVLDEPLEAARAAPSAPVPRVKGHIRFEDVWVRRDGGMVLRGFSLEIQSGTRLGITGVTGAGKTTLLDLLLRFFEPDAGRIVLDGQELSTLPVDALRRQFAIALQEPVLLEGSVAENIAYGSPGADRRAVIEAARVANVDRFVEQLPHGYDTHVEPRGVRLSGGERQRIALARAIVRDAPVLLLDEPTSSLDPETERAVIECLRRITEGRTSIVVSHHPSVLSFCDRVVVLREGRCHEVR